MDSKRIDAYFNKLREETKPEEIDEKTKKLRLDIMRNLAEPEMKEYLSAIIQDPENHEELMRELIMNRGFSEPQPYEVFRNTVHVAIEVVTATMSSVEGEQIVDTLLALAMQGERLAVKISDRPAALRFWLYSDEILQEKKLWSIELKRLFLFKLSELLEELDDYDGALEAVNAMEEVSRENEETESEINLMLQEGELYRKKRDLEKAEEIFKKSLEMAEKHDTDGRPISRAWLGLARISNSKSDIEESIRCFANAIDEAGESGENRVLLEASDELGYLFAQMERYEESWQCLNNALNTALSAEDVPAQVKIVQTMWYPAESMKKWGDYLVALRSVRHYVQSEQMDTLLAPLLECFGKVHIALGNASEAKRHLEEAHSLYSSLGNE